jgi:hypothetical protein
LYSADRRRRSVPPSRTSQKSMRVRFLCSSNLLDRKSRMENAKFYSLPFIPPSAREPGQPHPSCVRVCKLWHVSIITFCAERFCALMRIIRTRGARIPARRIRFRAECARVHRV